MEQFQIKINASIPVELVKKLYDEADFGKPTEDLARLQRMVDETPLVLSVWEKEKLVGFARCLTDFEYVCYLNDLLFLPEYRELGLGRTVMVELEKFLGSRVTITLRSDETTVAFYQKIGYQAVDNLYRISRET